VCTRVLLGTCTVPPKKSDTGTVARASTHLPSLAELRLLGGRMEPGKGSLPIGIEAERNTIPYAIGAKKTITHTSRKTTQCGTINKWE